MVLVVIAVGITGLLAVWVQILQGDEEIEQLVLRSTCNGPVQICRQRRGDILGT